MCTTGKNMCVADSCFCAEQDDGINAYGWTAASQARNMCTRNKQFLSATESAAYDVTIPAVENLMFRSACCCYYCGLGCRLEDKPLGFTNETTMLCYQCQGGCQVLTTAVKKRACCTCMDQSMCLACETPGATEFIIIEDSNKGQCFCCLEYGNAMKISFCPSPITCCGNQGQTCCVYSRCNFPCNDLTPCELGLCGIFCIKKEELIKEAEQRIRDRQSGGAVEAVIVEKGGAPAECMVR
jgi:hypothetical protein